MIFTRNRENESVIMHKAKYLLVLCEIMLDFKKIKWKYFNK